jgi:FixJ family two-component response regulator
VPGATLYSMSSSRNINIAVIDDDESICRSMSRLLRAAHLQPITYPSAEAFLADTRRPKFDCLVLDIQLKGMSGLDLSQRLSAVKDATPVIFITAHDDPEVRTQAEASDCAGYFRKTDSGADILAAIRHATGLGDSDSARKPGMVIDLEPTP